MRVNKNRKGSALAFALFIAGVLLVSETFLINQNRSNLIHRKMNIESLQSYFAAKSGVQHVLLKCQIIPTQLYDAASFAKGRNPYFDFGQYPTSQDLNASFTPRIVGGKKIKSATSINPGPRFLITGSQGWTLDNCMNCKSTLPSTGKSNARKFLDRFTSDIVFATNMQGTFTNYTYPYSFRYEVGNFEVLSLENQQKYHNEALKFTVNGYWLKNPEGTETKETTLETIVRIKRNG